MVLELGEIWVKKNFFVDIQQYEKGFISSVHKSCWDFNKKMRCSNSLLLCHIFSLFCNLFPSSSFIRHSTFFPLYCMCATSSFGAIITTPMIIIVGTILRSVRIKSSASTWLYLKSSRELFQWNFFPLAPVLLLCSTEARWIWKKSFFYPILPVMPSVPVQERLRLPTSVFPHSFPDNM